MDNNASANAAQSWLEEIAKECINTQQLRNNRTSKTTRVHDFGFLLEIDV